MPARSTERNAGVPCTIETNFSSPHDHPFQHFLTRESMPFDKTLPHAWSENRPI